MLNVCSYYYSPVSPALNTKRLTYESKPTNLSSFLSSCLPLQFESRSILVWNEHCQQPPSIHFISISCSILGIAPNFCSNPNFFQTSLCLRYGRHFRSHYWKWDFWKKFNGDYQSCNSATSLCVYAYLSMYMKIGVLKWDIQTKQHNILKDSSK